MRKYAAIGAVSPIPDGMPLPQASFYTLDELQKLFGKIRPPAKATRPVRSLTAKAPSMAGGERERRKAEAERAFRAAFEARGIQPPPMAMVASTTKPRDAKAALTAIWSRWNGGR